MTDNLFWRNRIVESGAADPQELAKGYNPDNWRFHPQIQRDALEDALDSIGVLQPVLFNKSSGRVIDGHLRIELAILKGQPLIPVNYVELTDDEEALALATLDAITEQAEPIPDKLAALLERTREMTADRPGLGAMLQRLKERAGINGHQSKEDAGPQIDKAAELQKVWGVKVGDVWELGQHRLVCGDCTDRAVVEVVMRGERAEACVTDPPYDIGKAEWDNIEDYINFLRGVGLQIQANLKDHGSLYLFGWPEKISSAFSEFPFENKRLLAWYYDNKNAPSQATWGRSFELIIYAWIDQPIFNKDAGRVPYKESSLERAKYGLNSKFGGGVGDAYELNPLGAQPRDVLIYPTLAAGRGQVERVAHPTQKPLDLISLLVSVSSNPEMTIFDPFLGSGTTLIAAHRLGRVARGIELNPNYAAVSIHRWQQLTGQTPRRVSG